MITYIQVQENLADSDLSQEKKERIIGYLPKCGPRVLDFLYSFFGSYGVNTSVDRVIEILELLPVLYEHIRIGDSETARIKFLKIWSGADRLIEEALLSVVLDIQDNPQLSEKLDSDSLRAFSVLEVIYLDQLLPKEVVRMLGKSVLSVAEFTNVAEELKRYCYVRSIEDPNNPQFREFREALESNQELVGTTSLQVGGQKIPPTVGGWIKAFSEAGVGKNFAGSYNVAYFLTNDPVAIKLTKQLRASLAEVLRLSVWLSQPEIYEAEMERFESERGDYYDGIKAQLLNVLSETAVPTPVTPSPQVEPSIQMDVTPKPLTAKPFVPPASMPDFAVVKTKLGGLSLEDVTNIKIEEEAKRVNAEREKQKAAIQIKLEELRKRNSLS